MKSFLKVSFIFSLILSLTIFSKSFASSLPPVIDLEKEGREYLLFNKYLKTLSAGEEVTYKFDDKRPHYIENIVLTAEGAQSSYSFAKVFADGEEIATLGVPGKDPLYPIVVRGEVSQITIRVSEKSKVKFTGMKLFTVRKDYSSYRGIGLDLRKQYSLDNWGAHVLDATTEMMNLTKYDSKVNWYEVKKYLVEMRRIAFKIQANENVRDERSLKIFDLAQELVKSIDRSRKLLDQEYFVMNPVYSNVILDLYTLREDIVEQYDLDI